MTPNKSLIYKKVPKGLPVPGQDLVVETREIDLDAAPPAGGLVVKVLFASFDPYLRGRMREAGTKSYTAPLALDEPVVNDTVARVLASASPDFQPGDVVKVQGPVAEYAVVPDPKAQRVLKVHNPHDLDLAVFTGALGMPGLTAYSSLHRIGRPKAGETIFVSSAAGAVGQLVGQIAKKEGLTVIGSVGSDEKLDFITKELGFDAGFNYKTEKPADALRRLAPNGIDIYYENVGGEHLDAALANMNVYGRIVACGMISQYNNTGDAYAVKNIGLIVPRQLTMQGFIVSSPDFGPAYYKEHQEKVQAWLADGSLRVKMSFTEGIDHAAEGLVGIFEGKNFGKAVLRI
ncbi:NADP-dependent leukotriene B4 12-hydroxydehydrogenase [Moelleriella libera RCEF 2490]|uniref:Dehydrogenase FUB6 n=1 Tax=Moelleriella libera RCEF 2490 TaxID=1081109 RepID=A0A166UTX1_9HYPO|nr:NADP-dependent leukotriene B4 12-hydroxydehydrogenase [Moelleriella libera RCEF 2490]